MVVASSLRRLKKISRLSPLNIILRTDARRQALRATQPTHIDLGKAPKATHPHSGTPTQTHLGSQHAAVDAPAIVGRGPGVARPNYVEKAFKVTRPTHTHPN